LAGEIPTKGLSKELKEVYNTLNNPQKHGKNFGPQHAGYEGEDIPRELMAEAIRAYMEAPAYLKTVAPKTAARIRANVNDNPRVKGIIQFNSVAAPLAMIAAADRNAEAENKQSTQGMVDQFITGRLQKDLIEAITGKPMTKSVQVNGKDIPIGHPEVLSRQDVFDLMQSKEYNQAARVNHKQTVNTVRGFFEQTSPGKVSLANGQRATSTINDIPNRPSTAPAAMKDLGPIGSILSSDQQQSIQNHFSDRGRSQQSKNSPSFGVFDGRNSDKMPDSWSHADSKTRIMSTGWRDPDGALQTKTQSLDIPTSGPHFITRTTSITNRHVVQNQTQKNKDEKAKQAQLDQARQNIAKQHQDYVSSSQATHADAAKAAKEQTESSARATNPDFDTKHGLTSLSQKETSDAFSGRTNSSSAITGALGNVDNNIGVLGNEKTKAQATRSPSAAANVAGKNAQQGKANASEGSHNSNTDANGYNNDTGFRDDDPSTAKDERGFRDFGSWMDAIGQTIETGWHGSPNKNPHSKPEPAEMDRPGPGKKSGGFCYITTAAVTHMGLPDQCEELETLRYGSCPT
jgi:hypothetical protein